LEGPAVGEVGLRVTVVVDVDVIAGVGRELVEVRPARRGLERQPVRHQRGGALLVGADERVHVGVVVLRLPGDERCLTVAGGYGMAWGQARKSPSDEDTARGEQDADPGTGRGGSGQRSTLRR